MKIKVLGKLFLKKKTNKQTKNKTKTKNTTTKQKQKHNKQQKQTATLKLKFRSFAVIEYYFLSYCIYSCLLFAKC